MKDLHSMTDKEFEQVISLNPQRQVRLSIATICTVAGSLILWVVLGTMAYTSITNQQDDQSKKLEALSAIPEKLNELDRRLYALEIQVKLSGGAAPINNTNSGQGGHVNMGVKTELDTLKELPEVTTSQLGKLIDRTSETVTNRIREVSPGQYEYEHTDGKFYPARKVRNTFVIENPLYNP